MSEGESAEKKVARKVLPKKPSQEPSKKKASPEVLAILLGALIIGIFIFASNAIVPIAMLDSEQLANVNLSTYIIDNDDVPVDFFFIQLKGVPTTLASPTAIDDIVVNVTNATSFSVGSYVGVSSGDEGGRFYFGEVLSISGNNLTLDTPLDYAYSAGSFIFNTTRDLNVDGSTTPEIFDVRGAQGTNSTVIITRIMFKVLTDSEGDLGDFGDIAGGLTSGLVLRQTDGMTNNIFNVKTNGELAHLMYDWTQYSATNPGQGVNGFLGRYSFNGADKHSTVIKLKPEDQLQLIINDDLTSIASFRVIAEGRYIAVE